MGKAKKEKRMKIKGIDTKTNLSKSEEIKIIEALHEAFKGTGNYLENFFSSGVVEFVTAKINDDIIPASVVDRDKEVEQLFQDCKAVEKALEESNRKVGEFRSNMEDARAKRDELQRQVWTLQRTLDIEQQKNQTLQKEVNKADTLKDALKDFLASED